MLYMAEEPKASSDKDLSPCRHYGLQNRKYHAQPLVEPVSLNTIKMEPSGGHSLGGTSYLAVQRGAKQGSTNEADGVGGWENKRSWQWPSRGFLSKNRSMTHNDACCASWCCKPFCGIRLVFVQCTQRKVECFL